MWIGRRPDGTIWGAFAAQQKNDEFHPLMEEVADTHPDYVAFRDRNIGKVPPVDPVIQTLLNEIETLKGRLDAVETKP